MMEMQTSSLNFATEQTLIAKFFLEVCISVISA